MSHVPIGGHGFANHLNDETGLGEPIAEKHLKTLNAIRSKLKLGPLNTV
jgi:hypothetical protein